METKTITILDVRNALLAARKRTGDSTIGHAVESGRFQLQRITYAPNGKATICPLSGWVDARAHIANIADL